MELVDSELEDGIKEIKSDISSTLENNSESEEEENIIFQRSNKKAQICSDDEEDKLNSLINNATPLIDSDHNSRDSLLSDDHLQRPKQRLIANLDSDSEDDEPAIPKEKIQYRSDVFDTNSSDEQNDPESHVEGKTSNNDDVPRLNSEGENDIQLESKTNICSKKKRVSKNRTASIKARELVAQEIHSESQRLIRESPLSLPYHKPKQRTVNEFLNRFPRRSYSSQLNNRVSLKSSMKDMSLLKELEERRNSVGKFYKSDSDSEEEEEEEKETITDKTKLTSDQNLQNKHLNSNIAAASLSKNETSSIDDPLDNTKYPSATSLSESYCNKLIISNNSQPFICNEISENIENSPSEISTTDSLMLVNSINNLPQEDDSENLPGQSQNQEILFEQETENDFHLRFDTEDFLEEDTNSKKPLCADDSTNITLENSDSHESEKGVALTPKLKLLKKRFPDVDLSNITKFTPKLSCNNNVQFIDLNDDEEIYNSVNSKQHNLGNLIDRFLKHSTKRKSIGKHKQALTIISKEKAENGKEELVNKTITFDLTGEEEEEPKECVPGAQLLKLKSALKKNILIQREKDRLRRVKEKQFIESEEVIQDIADPLPLNEEELTDPSNSEEETESEPEVDDIIITDKRPKRNAFIDDEAEDDDMDDESYASSDNESIVSQLPQASNTRNEAQSYDESSNSTDAENIAIPMNRNRLSRIEDDDVSRNNEASKKDEFQLQYLKEDSSDEDEDIDHPSQRYTQVNSYKRDASFFTRRSSEDLFSTQAIANLAKKESGCSNDYGLDLGCSPAIPCYQPGGGFETSKENEQEEEDEQQHPDLSIDSSLHDFPDEVNRSARDLSFNLLTPSKNTQTTSSKITELLDDSSQRVSNTDDDHSNVTELLGLCSGQFTVKKAASSKMDLLFEEKEGLDLTQKEYTQSNMNELLGLCSGKFTANDQEKKVDDLYQDINLAPTQIVNDLVDLCSGNFSSPPKSHSIQDNLDSLYEQKEDSSTKEKDVADSSPRKRRRVLIYSSDEEGIIERQKNQNFKRRKRKMLGQKESNDSDLENSDEDIPRPKKDSLFTSNGGLKSAFLDKEAELSGSEMSEDEEEPDEENDILELEEGDTEKFDEDELREQVGRAHFKSLLDNDKRELRLLQEMYFEDGDLHGEGRQRKFRWKNVGNDDTEQKISDDDKDSDNEAEEDAEWRRQRIEREKFMKEQSKDNKNAKSPDDNALAPIFKSSSLNIVRRQSFLSKKPLDNTSQMLQSPLTFLQHGNSIKRTGSFILKDKSKLEKLAEIAKENQTIGGAKEGGNFVFKTLSAEEAYKNRPRKNPVNTSLHKTPQSCPKNSRLQRSFFSMDETSQSSSIFKHL